MILELAVAIICGGIVGVEREITGKVAGLRTSILVCLGSTIFTLVSKDMASIFDGDPTRIAAQIVTGVGFLGAGTILREFGRGITGLTTAAIIWLMAAIGMMIGIGELLLAIGVSICVVLMMFLFSRFEGWLHIKHSQHFTLSAKPERLEKVKSLMTIYQTNIADLSIQENENSESTVSFRFVGANTEEHDFLKLLYEIDDVYLTGNRN